MARGPPDHLLHGLQNNPAHCSWTSDRTRCFGKPGHSDSLSRDGFCARATTTLESCNKLDMHYEIVCSKCTWFKSSRKTPACTNCSHALDRYSTEAPSKKSTARLWASTNYKGPSYKILRVQISASNEATKRQCLVCVQKQSIAETGSCSTTTSEFHAVSRI